MPGIKDVAIEFEAFTRSLSDERQGLIESISSLNNGFEGWLKLEFYFWLIKNRGLRALRTDEEHDIGMEYKVALDQRHTAMDRQTKQCDLWIRDHDGSGYHFVELKAPFANANQGKLMQSAADDLWYMSRLKAGSEKVVSGSSILLGVGFDTESWSQHIDYLSTYSGKPVGNLSVQSGALDEQGHIRWAALITRY